MNFVTLFQSAHTVQICSELLVSSDMEEVLLLGGYPASGRLAAGVMW